MPEAFSAALMSTFGVVPEKSRQQLESRSGADLIPVRTAGGTAAYLKVTPAGARRELRFYRQIARHAPVRTPRLLDHADTADGVALLLEATGESRDVRSWTQETWRALGRDLAALHGMPLPAGTDWQVSDADPDWATIEAFWGPELLARRAEFCAARSALPQVFMHGDCHTENIAHAGNALVFCDWQAAGIGRPVSDLAFVSVRATPAGVTVPPVFLDAYCEHSPLDRGALERGVMAEELTIFLFQWPHYAAYNTPAGIDRVRRRVRDLGERWS
ncbi:aminoglycoside phosphotransferase family protein [Nonomuraea sp. NPDC050404]|uniref:phosphotransferase family protein n=1 Tax=Nonomuraea sp. NPDC050404 TaxID=3155783 RepID=UPI003404DA6A